MESISLVSTKLAKMPKIGKWQRQFIYCSSNSPVVARLCRVTTIIRSPAVLTKEAGSLIIVVTRETRATAEQKKPSTLEIEGFFDVWILDPFRVTND